MACGANAGDQAAHVISGTVAFRKRMVLGAVFNLTHYYYYSILDNKFGSFLHANFNKEVNLSKQFYFIKPWSHFDGNFSFQARP